MEVYGGIGFMRLDAPNDSLLGADREVDTFLRHRAIAFVEGALRRLS